MSDIDNVANGISTISKHGSVYGWRFVAYSILMMMSAIAALLFILILGIAISKGSLIQVIFIYGSIVLIFMVLTRFFWKKSKEISDVVSARQAQEQEAEIARVQEEAEKATAERLRIEGLPADERLIAENEVREANILSAIQGYNKIRRLLAWMFLLSVVIFIARSWSMPDILYVKVIGFITWLIVVSFFAWYYRIRTKEHKQYLESQRLDR